MRRGMLERKEAALEKIALGLVGRRNERANAVVGNHELGWIRKILNLVRRQQKDKGKKEGLFNLNCYDVAEHDFVFNLHVIFVNRCDYEVSERIDHDLRTATIGKRNKKSSQCIATDTS